MKNIWINYKTAVLEKNDKIELNNGLTELMIDENRDFINNWLPKELYNILCDADGQSANSQPLFIELKNNLGGLSIWEYRFLSLNEIVKTHQFVNNYTQGKINSHYIPFAKHEKKVGDKGSIIFTINNQSKMIYKTKYYEYDRFTTISEFSSEKFSENIDEFLKNQIIWQSFIIGYK